MSDASHAGLVCFNGGGGVGGGRDVVSCMHVLKTIGFLDCFLLIDLPREISGHSWKIEV